MSRGRAAQTAPCPALNIRREFKAGGKGRQNREELEGQSGKQANYAIFFLVCLFPQMLRKYNSFPRQAKAALSEEISVAFTELVSMIIIFSAFIRWKIEHIVCSGSPIRCSTRCLMKWERCPLVSIVTQLFHLFAHQIREDCSLLMGFILT